MNRCGWENMKKVLDKWKEMTWSEKIKINVDKYENGTVLTWNAILAIFSAFLGIGYIGGV